MKVLYKIICTLLIVLLVLLLVTPMALYVIVSLPSVQQHLCQVGETELTKLLGTNVEIESVSITPFNQLSVNNVTIEDDNRFDAVKIKTIDAGIDIYEYLKNDKIVITHAALIGLDAQLYKQDQSSPLNIQNIINNLKPKDKTKPPTQFDLRINTIVIRNSQMAYDIKSIPVSDSGFDKNHIKISDLNADIYMPQLKNDDFIFKIKRFGVKEQSGLSISDIQGDFHIASSGIDVNGLELSLNDTKLMFGDISLSHKNWDEFNEKIKAIPLDVEIKEGSYVSLADFAPFVPGFKDIKDHFNLNVELAGELNDLSINKFVISHPNQQFAFNASGSIKDIKSADDINIILPDFALNANAHFVANILEAANVVKTDVATKISRFGNIKVNGQFNGKPLDAVVVGDISTALGDAKVNLDYSKPANSKLLALKGDVKTSKLNLGAITSNQKLNQISANANFDVSVSDTHRKGVVDGVVEFVDFNNYRFNNIDISALIDGDFIEGNVNVDDPNVMLAIDGSANVNKKSQQLNLHADVSKINLDRINLSKKYMTLSAIVDAEIDNFNIEEANGEINISDFAFSDNPSKELNIKNIDIDIQNAVSPQYMSLQSDILNASIEGSYSFKTIVPTIKEIMSHPFPVLFGEEPTSKVKKPKDTVSHRGKTNDFVYQLTIKEQSQLLDYLNLSAELFAPITITGEVSHPLQKMNLMANIPYIAQKNKLIEKTQLEIDIDQSVDKCLLRAFSELPTKHGKMPLELVCNGSENQLDVNVNWIINRKETFKGQVNMSTLFSKGEDGALVTDLTISPSNLVFNDSVWTIQRAHIHYAQNNIVVDNFDVRHADQFINIKGKASPSPDDELCIDLKNVNLDYIFQTLEINNALLGGDATGTLYASQLFSKSPVAFTNDLKVKNISYNGTVLGNAAIKAHWDNERLAAHLDAIVSQDNGNKSYIYGDIFPTKEALDITFEANEIKVGFMKPYMAAFASDVDGFASGKARLFGTFKYIDLEGDIYAKDLKLKIDFTDTYYSATDSIHIRPGIIDIKDVTLRDVNGNTALLNGWVKHKFFKEPEFKFDITNAKNFLCYDVKERVGEIWHGHINGNGTANIDGRPGVVNINVDMATAPQSTFTFIISDMESAYEYSFLTFRDKDAQNKQQKATMTDEPIEVVKFKERLKKKEESRSSVYNMRIKVDVNPQAQLILVMDPVGGDKIKAIGSGTLRMTYSSRDEDLKMYGSYEIDEGSYNFTLQDIIIKDFKIRDNSSIAFNGDPFAAQLNIIAAYPVKANLSDLDESFLDDKDLNRTNVPVNALLYIKDDMTQPNISFDLEFPTLKQDAYSKVMSIISTDEMMKRQILYLLALNRFYTPEYMSATKGNEIFSVASSTLSSQLSSMLGQLSDNWTISPYLRSDLGDFSDVEVDLALSSTLLNNRLRLNGNFGYRDKSLNTNQFIGDFDIEYLLNQRGSWRLKAYNRYNDQNYYLKTATTTQGVGIMYRQDFDNMFSFLKFRSKKPNQIDTISVDSITTILDTTIRQDSVLHK